MLKANSKAVATGRKRKRFEVFDLGMPNDQFISEESKDDHPKPNNLDPFTDVSHMLKKSKRNRTPNKAD